MIPEKDLQYTPMSLASELTYVDKSFFSLPQLSHDDLAYIQKLLQLGKDDQAKESKDPVSFAQSKHIFQVLENYRHPSMTARIGNYVKSYWLSRSEEDVKLAQNICKMLEHPYLPKELLDLILPDNAPLLFDQLEKELQGSPNEADRLKRENLYWEGFANQIGIILPQVKTRPVKEYVKDYVTAYKKYIAGLPEGFPREVEDLLKLPASISSMRKLKEWKAARDTLKIIEVLEKDCLAPHVLSGKPNVAITATNSVFTFGNHYGGQAIFKNYQATLFEASLFESRLADGVFSRLPSFNKLNLSILPDAFTKLPITHLNLRDNQIERLPESMNEMSSLQTLDLVNNQLIDLPQSILNLNQLQTVIMHNNPVDVNHLSPVLKTLKEQGKIYFSNQ